MQHELKEAANDKHGVTSECLTTAVTNSIGPIMASPSAMPTKASIRFVSTYSLKEPSMIFFQHGYLIIEYIQPKCYNLDIWYWFLKYGML